VLRIVADAVGGLDVVQAGFEQTLRFTKGAGRFPFAQGSLAVLIGSLEGGFNAPDADIVKVELVRFAEAIVQEILKASKESKEVKVLAYEQKFFDTSAITQIRP
jgi:hypothetical protein